MGSSLGEEHGNPFQYSCLENPMDGGAWWAAVHGNTKSRTRLKQLNTHTNHINKMKNENHMIGSRDKEKAFDKIQHQFIRKILNKVGIKGAYLNITKAMYDKLTANIYSGEKLKAFPLQSRTK